MNNELAVFVMITSTIVAMFFFGRWVGERSNLKELNWLRRESSRWFIRFERKRTEVEELKARLSSWDLADHEERFDLDGDTPISRDERIK